MAIDTTRYNFTGYFSDEGAEWAKIGIFAASLAARYDLIVVDNLYEGLRLTVERIVSCEDSLTNLETDGAIKAYPV